MAIDGQRGAASCATSASDVSDDASSRPGVRRAGPDDLATIIYTSGTTGRPKGCVLTHGNFLFELTGPTTSSHELFDAHDGRLHAAVPAARPRLRPDHPGRCVKARRPAGAHRRHQAPARRPRRVPARPSSWPCPGSSRRSSTPPRQRAVADGRGKVFDRAADVGHRLSAEALEPGRPGLGAAAQHALFDRLVYAKLRAALGGSCAYAVSGGAPLGERLGHFFRGIGVTVLEGYGLTETTAALTVNLPDAQKVGTVGRPAAGHRRPGRRRRRAAGPRGQVFAGYWHNDEATAEAKDADGWFRTGDLGEIDDEGFVRITGRKKEILVTAGGKNVAPAVLEDRLRAHPLVSQCMVVGDGQPYIAALVTLDPEALPAWAEQHGKSGDVGRPRPTTPTCAPRSSRPSTRPTRRSPRRSRSGGSRSSPSDWTEEGGQLTPSLKLKRGVVMREHRDDVDALYVR